MAIAAEAGVAKVSEAPPAQPAVAITQKGESSNTQDSEDDARWVPVLRLPCELIVDLPLPGFTVADFLQLRTGSVINAHWRLGLDVPLRLNGMLIAAGEFEVVGNGLAVRLTELA